MDRIEPPVDEYTLAAYIDGTLPEKERAAVTAYLAENAEARELLQMAYQALAASRPEEPLAAQARPALQPSGRPAAPAERPARPPLRRVSSLMRYVAAAAVVVGLGFGLRLAFVPPADELRYDPADAKLEVSVRGSLPQIRLVWEAVDEADRYRVVVYDLERAETVAEYEVSQSRLSGDRPEVRDLNQKLSPGRSYAVRVDAVDRANRVVQTSESVTFTPER